MEIRDGCQRKIRGVLTRDDRVYRIEGLPLVEKGRRYILIKNIMI
jgi:hypothetical protein